MKEARPTSTTLWFYSFSNLTTLTNFDYLNTSEVTDMKYMFYYCSSLTKLDVRHFNTANVTDMTQLFRGCSKLTSLDLSNFNTSKVTDMSGMFSDCKALVFIYCNDDWSANTELTYSSNMFYGCTGLIGGNGTRYDANYTNATYAHPDEEGNPGYFTKKTPTGIEEVEGGKSADAKVESRKILRDGKLYILRDGKTYNAIGQEVR